MSSDGREGHMSLECTVEVRLYFEGHIRSEGTEDVVQWHCDCSGDSDACRVSDGHSSHAELLPVGTLLQGTRQTHVTPESRLMSLTSQSRLNTKIVLYSKLTTQPRLTTRTVTLSKLTIQTLKANVNTVSCHW